MHHEIRRGRTVVVAATIFSVLNFLWWEISFYLHSRGQQYPSGVSQEAFLTNIHDKNERKLAAFLIGLQVQFSHEKIGVTLDEPVFYGDKNKRRTLPDFYLQIGGMEFFIEVGATIGGYRKRGQLLVMQQALSEIRDRRLVYVQLDAEDVQQMCDEVGNVDELFAFLINHENSVSNVGVGD